MKSLSQFLEKRKKESPHKYPRKGECLDEKTVLYITEKVISEEYGKKGVENVIPKRYKEKKLFIHTKHSVWASEIILEKEKLCMLLNKKLGQGMIQEIRVQK